jgi:DNA-binding ferritin-like protein
MKRSDMALIAFSFRNSLHHWHINIEGTDFWSLHELIGEYYDDALEVFDYYRERAKENGEKVPNLNEILKTPAGSSFPYANDETYDSLSFSQEFDKIGNEFLDALKEFRDDMDSEDAQGIVSHTDDIYDEWDNKINYLNKQRLSGLK